MPKLGLRGTALAVYAVIYSFTEKGQTWRGSCSTLAERVGSTRGNVNEVLASLVKRGLIKRTDGDRSESSNAFPEYAALVPETDSGPVMRLSENPTGVSENPTGVSENPTGGVGKPDIIIKKIIKIIKKR